MYKTAIITGAGRGIGKETALLLAKNGLNIAVCSRTQCEIDSVIEEIKKLKNNNSNAFGMKCDVSKPLEVNQLVQKTIDRFEGVDILVNNAGIAFISKLIDTSEEQWDKTIDINLKGTFLCTKAVLPFMLRNGSGVIINVSSGAGKIGFPNISAYCASKFGMIGLTESLAWEVSDTNILVMAICPGEVNTRMQEDLAKEYHRENKSKMLRPEQIAQRIVEMIFNNRHQYVSGQSVIIDT
jgi:3-oxoacyl-[acyl-carrier protein] reductase